MIVTSGYNVFPVELEEIIEGCELVEKCCVAGVKDEVRVEIVKAYIKLEEGVEANDTSLDIIKNYCMEHIARYAIPREYEFVETFETTRMGKLDYSKLGADS